MSLSSKVRTVAAAAVVAGLIAFAGGCESQQRSGGSSQNTGTSQQKAGTSQQKGGTQTRGSQQRGDASGATTSSASKDGRSTSTTSTFGGSGSGGTTSSSAAKPATSTTSTTTTAPAAAAPAVESRPITTSGGACPAYRPNVPGGYNITQAAFPTGDARSSAIMLSTMAPGQVMAGKDYTYEVHVTNLTNQTLQNVAVTQDSLANLNVKASDPAAQRAADGDLVWNVGNLGACQTRVIKVNGSAAQAGQQATGCFTVVYNSSVCMATNVVSPALKITKATAPAEGTPCDTFTYTIEVTNPGSGSADNVRIQDTLPAGMTLTNGGTSINDAIGNLGAGQKATRSYQVKAAKPGSYNNKATALADGGLSAESNTVTNVVKQPALALAAECPKDTRIGKGVTAKFTVRNTGDAACSNTRLVATLPNGSSGVTADGGGAASGNTVNWNVGNLAVGESKTFTINFKPGAGSNQIAARVECGCATPATANCTFGVTGVPDIGTGIEDFVGVRNVGDEHEYEYVVKNQGQVDLTNVKMVADFDAGLDYTRTDYPGGATASGRNVTWNIGTLAVGQQRKFKLYAKTNKTGDLIVRTTTTSDQTSPVRNDEQVNCVD